MMRTGYPEESQRYPAASDVLVIAANPGLERLALVASLRRPVQDRVVAHQELDPAEGGPIGLVDSTVLEHEGAHRRDFRDVLRQIRPRGRGIGTCIRRPRALGRDVSA